MRTTHITVFLYHNNIAENKDPRDPLRDIRCMHCGYKLGRANGRILTLANTMAPGVTEIPLGMDMFEVKCKNCNTVHSILWQ